jgi:NAD(P)-dependent dehydrogenase (short-subunit alcohol dehydrogenase family)
MTRRASHRPVSPDRATVLRFAEEGAKVLAVDSNLASDEANFITGVALPVDGGALVDIN